MSRKKLFIENMLSFGLINLLTKIIPFLLLPIITKALPNPSDFGIYSMFQTITGFGVPIALFGISDAVFREYFKSDDEERKKDVIRTSNIIILITTTAVTLFLIIFREALSVNIIKNPIYDNIIILSALTIFFSTISSNIQLISRLKNKIKVFALTGIISALVMYGLSLYLINIGYSYYGLIYGNLITAILMLFFFAKINFKDLLVGSFRKDIAKALIKIGLPLLPTVLIYWVFNSMDRIMISRMIGDVQLGIYSVGAKMAQISQIIYSGFAGGYGFFKYSTMKDSDQVEMNSRLFEMLLLFISIVFICTNPFIKMGYDLLFVDAYSSGYIVVAPLFLCPLLLMLFQVLSTQFIVDNKSYISSSILGVGALGNLVLNLFLIPAIGIEGAAYATLIGYFISLLLAIHYGTKHKLFVSNRRIWLLISFLTLDLLSVNIIKTLGLLITIIVSLSILILIGILYKKDLQKTIRKLRGSDGE